MKSLNKFSMMKHTCNLTTWGLRQKEREFHSSQGSKQNCLKVKQSIGYYDNGKN